MCHKIITVPISELCSLCCYESKEAVLTSGTHPSVRLKYIIFSETWIYDN